MVYEILFIVSVVIIIMIVLFVYYSYTTRVRNYSPSFYSDTLSQITKSSILYNGALDEAFEMIAKEGCSALNVQCIAIWIFSGDMKLLEKSIVYEADDVKTMVQDTVDMENNPEYKDIILSQRVFTVNDVKAMQNPLAASIGADEPTLCAYMDAPVRASGKPYGVVSFEQHKCKDYPQRRVWSLAEQSFASSLADFLAFAVESSERRRLEDAVFDSTKRIMLMLDTSPLCTQIWDRNLNTIDCNEAGVKLYGFKDKQEYIEKFIELCSPKYQIDGQRSDEKAVKLVNKAFKDGYCSFEWLHKMPYDNTLIPAEVTLVRVKYNDDDDVVLGYTRDLRDQYEMMKNIQHRDKLLEAVNRAASLLHMTDENTDISETLIKSMELVGTSIGVDHIQLWRNEDIDGDLHFVNQLQWISDKRKDKTNLPAGIKVSYSYIPEWKSILSQGKYINAPLKSVPDAVRSFYNDYGITSAVIVPLFIDDYFWGFLNISDCDEVRYFNDDEITIFKSISLMMINALTRQELIEKRTHELALQTTMFTTLFDSIPDLIFIKDLDLKYIKCNKGFLEFFNCAVDDVIGKTNKYIQGILNDDLESFSISDNKVLKDSKPIVVEESLTQIDGSVSLFETIKAPLIINGNAEGIVGIARDITKRKEMEQYVINARDEANIANNAKSAFLAKMSHELRTPMNAILGVTEILVHSDDLKTDVREGLDRIYSSCTLLLGLINDILDLSKIEAGKMDLTPVKYKTASMINDSIQLNIIKIESKPLDFIIQINETIPAVLIGDELRITQILNNLLSNAFKYTNSGTVTLQVDWQPGQSNDEIDMIINIRDTGIGMTTDQLDRLFTDYSRFDTESQTEGVGLGLAISKQLISLMEGDIRVESEPGVGSLFSIRFPQKKVNDDVLGLEIVETLKNHTYDKKIRRERRQEVRDMMPYGHVLIVDDVETNRFVAAGLLKRYKLNIETAESGYEAIEKVKNGNVYDIIFMDHMMPGMDGIEATRRLREMGYGEPIIALTANVVAGQSDIYMQNGFNEFIAKPVDIRLLTTMLNKFIRDKQTPEILAAVRLQSEAEKAAAGDDRSDHIKQPYSQAFLNMLNEGIDGLDIDKGFERYHGEEKTFLEILNTYVNDMNSLLDGLIDSCSDDLSEFAIKVHSIKGMSLSIYADQIGERARLLEKSAESNDIDYINEHTSVFVDDAYKMINEITEKMKVIEAESKENDSKITKDSPDIDVLNRLMASAMIYDIGRINEAMEDIEQYQYESDDGLVVWLREKVDLMKYMDIVDKLSDYCK